MQSTHILIVILDSLEPLESFNHLVESCHLGAFEGGLEGVVEGLARTVRVCAGGVYQGDYSI